MKVSSSYKRSAFVNARKHGFEPRLEAVPDRERERHAGADPEHEQTAGDPTDAGKSDTGLAGTNLGQGGGGGGASVARCRYSLFGS